MLSNIITNISMTENVALVILNNIPNRMSIISEIFSAIADCDLNIDMISQTAPYKEKISMSFTLPQDNLDKIVIASARFKKISPDIVAEVNSNNVKIIFSGKEMESYPGVAASVFSLFCEHDILIKMITTSETEISCLIDEKDKKKVQELIKIDPK